MLSRERGRAGSAAVALFRLGSQALSLFSVQAGAKGNQMLSRCTRALIGGATAGILQQVLGLAVVPAQQERLALQGPGLVASQLGKGLLPVRHAAPRSSEYAARMTLGTSRSRSVTGSLCA